EGSAGSASTNGAPPSASPPHTSKGGRSPWAARRARKHTTSPVTPSERATITGCKVGVPVEARTLLQPAGAHASVADPAGGNGHDPRGDPRAPPERVPGARHRRDRGQPACPRSARGEDRSRSRRLRPA